MIPDAHSLVARIAFWRNAELSPWEFERRVLDALVSAGVKVVEEAADADTRERAAAQRAVRDAEIDRTVNGKHTYGAVAKLAAKWNISRNTIYKIARAMRT